MKVLVDPRLWKSPKLAKLARALGKNRLESGAHLIILWSYAIEYRLDGDLRGMAETEIAEAAGWNGDAPRFCTILRETGWLDGTKIHDWHEHQGQYIERLLRDRARKRRGRSADSPRSVRTPVAVAVAVARSPLPVAVAGSQKHTNNGIARPVHPVGNHYPVREPLPRYQPDPRFNSVAAKWPGLVDEAEARIVFERLKPPAEDIASMLDALKPENWPPGWSDDGGRYIPNLSTWLAKHGHRSRRGAASAKSEREAQREAARKATEEDERKLAERIAAQQEKSRADRAAWEARKAAKAQAEAKE